MLFHTLLCQKQQSSEGDTVKAITNGPAYSFIMFINKVYYNGALICITTDHYKILHILLRTHVILKMQGPSQNSLPTGRLASGELTTGARSCFLYSSHVLAAGLCKASPDDKRTQF